MGSTSFIESFMAEALHEDLGTIFSLPMFADLQVAFAMLSLCYAQCLGYLLCTMFPAPGILQHYVEFNICIITKLEKLLSVGSFGGSISHLIYHHVIFPTFSGRLDLPFVVWIVALAFLGC